jgi:hypothetical protein
MMSEAAIHSAASFFWIGIIYEFFIYFAIIL